MKIKTVDVQADSDGKFKCPECGEKSNDRAHLGIHRKLKHNILGRPKLTSGKIGRPIGSKNRSGIPKPDAFSPTEISRAQRLAAGGLTQREIAERMNRSMSTVSRHLREFKPNPKGVSSNGHQPPVPTPSIEEQHVVSEAWFQLGQLYSTVEKHIDEFAGKTGCPFTVDEIALRVGDTLRAKAAQIRKHVQSSELLRQMREERAAAGGGGQAEFGGHDLGESALVHVHSRGDRPLRHGNVGRVLTAKSRAKIAAAQRRRWRLQKRVARANAIRAKG